MNQNEGYSSNRRRNQRKNERNRNEKSSRNERKNLREERSAKNERKSHEHDSRDKRKNSQKNQRNSQQREFQNEIFKMLQKSVAENDAAIRSFKSTSTVCELCGQPISAIELGSAVSGKNTDNPVHFDCVLNQIIEEEKPGLNEKVTYIGQGKFAVLHFENPNDLKHFTIRRTIEWEKTEERLDWRNEMAGLFSQII